jgi:hypothetical protein
MIEFNLDGKDYEIKEYLSIGDYQKIFKVKDLFEDEYLNAKIINLLTDCPMDTLVNAEKHKIDFLATLIFTMVPKQPINLIDRFELDGIEYGYLPSYKKITFGEFVDLDTLLTKKPEEVIDYLHIITAIMYRPIVKSKSKHNFEIEKYDAVKMEERAELFKNKFDIKFTLGGQFFFTQFVNNSSNFTRLSLKQKIRREWEVLKILWKHRKLVWRLALKKDTDGTLLSIELQMEILRSTIKSMRKTSLKY